MATRLITMNDILAGHVSLDVAYLDRHAVPSQRRQPATSRFLPILEEDGMRYGC